MADTNANANPKPTNNSLPWIELGILVLGLACGCLIGALCMNEAWIKAAIEHEAGAYVVVKKFNKMAEFKWNDELTERELKGINR